MGLKLNRTVVDFRGDDRLARETEAAHRLGFGGKLLIHPRQVTVARAAFAPSQAEIAWAQQVIAVFEETGSNGAVTLNGKMIDKPVVDSARRILNSPIWNLSRCER